MRARTVGSSVLPEEDRRVDRGVCENHKEETLTGVSPNPRASGASVGAWTINERKMTANEMKKI